MSFTVNVGGFRVFSRRVESLIEAAAIMTRDEVVAQMEPGEARTGNTYMVPETKQPYTASAAGEAPAVREGNYVASWKYTPPARQGDVVRARAYTDLKVGSAEEYVLGDLLEHGTSDLVNFRVRMEPRPHVRPAFELVQPKIAELVQRASSA